MKGVSVFNEANLAQSNMFHIESAKEPKRFIRRTSSGLGYAVTYQSARIHYFLSRPQAESVISRFSIPQDWCVVGHCAGEEDELKCQDGACSQD